MEERKAYIDKLAAQLKEWDTKIQKLEAKAEKVKDDARAEYYQRIQELRTKQEEAESKVEKLRQAGEDAWEELKTGANQVFADTKRTFERVVSKFK